MAHNDHSYTSLSSENVPKKKKRTGGYCCVAECNSSHSRGFSLHGFPSDESIKRQWVRFVQTHRKDFGPKFGTPNSYSFICEKHFKSECYPLSLSIKRSMGIKTNAALIPGSVPTIYKPVCVTMSNSMSTESTTTITTQASTQARSTTVTTSVLSSVCSILPGVSQVRGAYAKRERQRVICELTASPPPDSTKDLAAAADNHMQSNSTFSTGDAGVQTNSCFMNTGKQTRTRSKRVQVHPCISFKAHYYNLGVQCNLDKEENSTRMCSQSVQCDLNLDTSYIQDETLDQCEPASDPASGPEDTECCDQADDHDEDYIPVEEESMDTDSASDAELDWGEKRESRKFIVFEECLLELFQHCQYCAQPASGAIRHIRGTFLSVKQECPHCGKDRVWVSQPFIKDIPAGNLYVSTAILFSGLLPSKALRFLNHLGVASISPSTFFDHQRAYLFPAIEEEWKSHQDRYVEKARESDYSLTLGGDGRADSPGHSAKYGTYTLLDLDLMMVIDTRVVQCNEEDVGSSCRMEKEGLKRCLSFLKDKGLDVCELVTDRNSSIIKHMKDNMPGVKHSFDVWHVAKGLKKKLLKVANTKDCQELSLWIRSIINHLYWTVVSTPEADGKLMLEKWQSLCNHLHNKHDHEGSAFPKCAHLPLEGQERRKKWLKEGSKVSVLTLDVLQSTYMLRDVPQLSTGPQTAAIEAFHSVLNHFAPKMIGFSYDGMVHRSILAAVHFNENSNRPQAQRKDGQLRYNVAFGKARKEFVVQGIKESCTFDYVQRLVRRVIRLASRCSLTDMEQMVLVQHQQQAIPPPMCASVTKTNKEDAVQQHRSRYNKK